MAIAAQQNDVSGTALRDEVEQPATRLGEILPLFKEMLAGKDLNPRADKIHIRRAARELLLQPFPLLLAEDVGVLARCFPMIAPIEQNHFHLLANRAVSVSRIYARLLSAGAVCGLV